MCAVCRAWPPSKAPPPPAGGLVGGVRRARGAASKAVAVAVAAARREARPPVHIPATSPPSPPPTPISPWRPGGGAVGCTRRTTPRPLPPTPGSALGAGGGGGATGWLPGGQRSQKSVNDVPGPSAAGGASSQKLAQPVRTGGRGVSNASVASPATSCVEADWPPLKRPGSNRMGSGRIKMCLGPRLTVTGGGGGKGGMAVWAPPPDPPTPPTHIRKFFLRKNTKFFKGVRNWRSILGTTFFWPLPPPPPPPRHRSRSPLSRGLVVCVGGQ